MLTDNIQQDAYVLIGLLAHPSTTPATVSRALKAYEQVRLPMAQLVMARSTMSGRLSGLAEDFGGDYGKFGNMMEKQWDWISGPDPLTELERAVRLCYPDEDISRAA